jgi:hypothetical protein
VSKIEINSLTLSPAKAAAYIGIGKTKMLELIRTKRIPVKMLDGRTRITADACRAFVRSLPDEYVAGRPVRYAPEPEQRERNLMEARDKSRRWNAQRGGYVPPPPECICPPMPSECQQCGKDAKLYMDHCHLTGAFLGWVCHGCNILNARPCICEDRGACSAECRAIGKKIKGRVQVMKV